MPVTFPKLVNLCHDSTFRPPNWRWEKAAILLAESRPPSRVEDDQYVTQVMAYQQEAAKVKEKWEECRLFRRFPGIYDACQLFAGNIDKPTRRFELEARLLARDSTTAGTSQRTGIPESAILWYERLFFHVRDRLDNVGYLLHQVIGPAIYQGMNEGNFEILWKLFAIYGGVKVLEDVTNILAAGVDTEDLRRFYRTQNSSIVAKGSTIAAMTLRQRDPFVKLQLMELHAKHIEIELQHGQSQAIDSGLLGAVQRVVGAIKLLTVDSGEGIPAGQVPVGFGAGGSEPRAAHLMAAAFGKPYDPGPSFETARMPGSAALADKANAEEDQSEVPLAKHMIGTVTEKDDEKD